jgi:hypothetical protein
MKNLFNLLKDPEKRVVLVLGLAVVGGGLMLGFRLRPIETTAQAANSLDAALRRADGGRAMRYVTDLERDHLGLDGDKAAKLMRYVHAQIKPFRLSEDAWEKQTEHRMGAELSCTKVLFDEQGNRLEYGWLLHETSTGPKAFPFASNLVYLVWNARYGGTDKWSWKAFQNGLRDTRADLEAIGLKGVVAPGENGTPKFFSWDQLAHKFDTAAAKETVRKQELFGG